MRLILFLCVLMSANCLFGQTSSTYELKNSDEVVKRVEARKANILQELSSLTRHPWAGHYYHGDGLGVNLSLYLAPKTGFAFGWSGCMGMYDRNLGSVTSGTELLELSFELPNDQKGFRGLADSFYPVEWSERTYLIEKSRMIDFCNAVNDGSEPRKHLHGHFFLRKGDEKTSVTGWPVIPEEYRTYLLDSPIRTRIASIDRETTRPSIIKFYFIDTIATLDRGRTAGILPGMQFRTIEPGSVYETARVEDVYETTSSALLTRTSDYGTTPGIGWVLSTRR